MSEQEIRKMIDDVYDDSKEEGLRQMMRDFYNRRNLTIVIVIWGFGIACMVGAVLCAMAFFDVESVRDQIMYAVGFLVCVQWLGQMKVFAWQMIHRNNIKRELKRLELRIAQLSSKSE